MVKFSSKEKNLGYFIPVSFPICSFCINFHLPTNAFLLVYVYVPQTCLLPKVGWKLSFYHSFTLWFFWQFYRTRPSKNFFGLLFNVLTFQSDYQALENSNCTQICLKCKMFNFSDCQSEKLNILHFSHWYMYFDTLCIQTSLKILVKRAHKDPNPSCRNRLTFTMYKWTEIWKY